MIVWKVVEVLGVISVGDEIAVMEREVVAMLGGVGRDLVRNMTSWLGMGVASMARAV